MSHTLGLSEESTEDKRLKFGLYIRQSPLERPEIGELQEAKTINKKVQHGTFVAREFQWRHERTNSTKKWKDLASFRHHWLKTQSPASCV